MKLSPEFEKAAVDIYKLEIEPPYDKKLIAYGYYKIATGVDFSKAGRYKYDTWKQYVDDGITPQAAEKKYIAFVEELKPKYKYNPNKVPVRQ